MVPQVCVHVCVCVCVCTRARARVILRVLRCFILQKARMMLPKIAAHGVKDACRPTSISIGTGTGVNTANTQAVTRSVFIP